MGFYNLPEQGSERLESWSRSQRSLRQQWLCLEEREGCCPPGIETVRQGCGALARTELLSRWQAWEAALATK